MEYDLRSFTFGRGAHKEWLDHYQLGLTTRWSEELSRAAYSILDQMIRLTEIQEKQVTALEKAHA